MTNRILSDASELSSGTIATLTGCRRYDDIDGWQADFCAYVRAFESKRTWDSWMDAWDEFKRGYEMTHTIDSVKDTLPSVNVCWRGNVYVGRVRGRLNKFATVYLEQFPEMSQEWAWPVIVRALNQGLELNWE